MAPDKNHVSSSTPTIIFSNPNQRLSSVLLNEFNYLPWSRSITLALGGRSKLDFIEKRKAPATNSPEYPTWLSQDQLVMSWLLNSMEPKMAEIFSYSESSYHLWVDVHDMYDNQNNAARVFQLKKETADLKQGDSAFVQYLGSLKAKWNELDLYRPHTTYSSVLVKRAEEDKVFQLLAGLSSNYEDLKSRLLMDSKLPSLQDVCSVVQREEVRKKVMNADVAIGEVESRPAENRVLGMVLLVS